MRKEIVHFLQHVQDENVMTFTIQNLNFDDLLTLFHYLQLADEETENHWLSVFQKIIEKGICSS